jgi:hypothetical protein
MSWGYVACATTEGLSISQNIFSQPIILAIKISLSASITHHCVFICVQILSVDCINRMVTLLFLS